MLPINRDDITKKLNLSTGISVRMLYRTEETVEPFKDRVELVKGDVTNQQDVENTLTGVDGVVVTLGMRKPNIYFQTKIFCIE